MTALETGSTQWGMVLLAGDGNSTDSQMALEKLCRRYWRPIFDFARRRGMGFEQAQDVTQSFFSHFLEKGYIRAADPNRGRFRAFLLTAFRHYCINEWNRLGRIKRGGAAQLFPWHELGRDSNVPVPSAKTPTPDRDYDRQWALLVMERGFELLKSEFETMGRRHEFDLLKGFLSVSAEDGEYETLGRSLDLRTGAVALRIHRLRQRYAELVREEVAQTVGDRRDVEEELRYLVDLILRE